MTDLIDRLRGMARASSEAQRMMAEAKSLRQSDCTPPRGDLYSWPKPEETLEWQAAEEITRLHAALGRLFNVCDSNPHAQRIIRGALPDPVPCICACLSELQDDAYGPGGPMSGQRKPRCLVHPTPDLRPANCTNRLEDEGKAHPKSGCAACGTRLGGCRHE